MIHYSLNGLNNSKLFYGKRVFVTGNTGFLGSYLTLCLTELGANVTGYSIGPPTTPNLYSYIESHSSVRNIRADVRDYEGLSKYVRESRPEIVYHLAAQPIVTESLDNPRYTFETNTMGTVNLLESLRKSEETRVVIVVTTDKVYKNDNSLHLYKEQDALGGSDPYSASKSSADIAVSSYRESYFYEHKVALSSVRAGNLIGGGDWGNHRLIPDIVRSIVSNTPITLRHRHSIRPWQYVLDLVNGMLKLAERMWQDARNYSEAWNFGPTGSIMTVGDLTSRFLEKWGLPSYDIISKNEENKEALYLQLNATKARERLDWNPKYTVEEAIDETVDWYKSYCRREDCLRKTLEQVKKFGY